MKRSTLYAWIAALLFAFVQPALCAEAARPAVESTAPVAVIGRNPAWAQPMTLPGVANLHKVSDTLYRGEQPTKEGMHQLAAMGVKTVVDLRVSNTDKKLLPGTGLAGVHISVKPWHGEDEDVIAFLKVADDDAGTPVYVHCRYGADRTGLMCAMYRIAVQGWPKEEAVREMTEGGFGFHSSWRNLVTYIRKADIDDIRRQAGLAK